MTRGGQLLLLGREGLALGSRRALLGLRAAPISLELADLRQLPMLLCLLAMLFVAHLAASFGHDDGHDGDDHDNHGDDDDDFHARRMPGHRPRQTGGGQDVHAGSVGRIGRRIHQCVSHPRRDGTAGLAPPFPSSTAVVQVF